MANKATTGTNPSQITYVTTSTLEKRCRRALAKQGQTLIKPKAGTAARRELGEYAIHDASLGGIVIQGAELESLARDLGVLADHERLDTPAREWDGWMHYIARQETIEIDGQTALHNRQISPEFTSPDAARAWLDESGLTGDDLRLVGYDATAGVRREGRS